MASQAVFALIPTLVLSMLMASRVGGQASIGCYVPVQCVGAISVGVSVISSPEECLGFCNSVPSCLYFTHYSESDYCIAFSNCPQTDADCTDCISGMFR